MIYRLSDNYLITCPQCWRVCKLQSGDSAADSLPTNMFSLNMLKLSLNQSAQWVGYFNTLFQCLFD